MTPTLPHPASPDAVARTLLTTLFAENNSPTLIYWRGDWWKYAAGSWAIVSELDLEGVLYSALGDATFEMENKDGTVEQHPWNPTSRRVGDVLHSLRARCNRLADDKADAPIWIRQADDDGPATVYVNVRNGMLNLRTRELFNHTPDLFTTYALDFDYKPEATAPTWTRFLSEVFAHDPKAADLLQEFAGYVISGRLDLHKALIMVGVRRSGKGTILRTLTQLMGAENVATTSLHALGSEFGNSSLIGKPLGIVADARADDSRGGNQATEFLLNVIGEDAVSLNRKGRSYWMGTLPTRFVWASNEVPRLLDASGAVVSRFIGMRLERSFEGNEDLDLGKKLTAELSGIYNWALEGLDRLEHAGRLTEPKTWPGLEAQLGAAAAPVADFISTHYEVTGDEADRIPRAEVYKSYRWWCLENGTKPASAETMSNRMQAGDPRLTTGHREITPRVLTSSGKPKRDRYVIGIRSLV